MKKIYAVLFLFLLYSFLPAGDKDKKYTQYVNPFVGTGGHGHTYPGASLPFGGVQLSPDTRKNNWDACSGYHYSDKIIFGFSHTHLSGTGVGDYGDILIMPAIGPLKVIPGDAQDPSRGYCSSFSHSREYAAPGYYRVKLSDYDIEAELTATSRCGFHRYTFPQSRKANIIIDLKHGISREEILDLNIAIINNKTIQGMRATRGWAKHQVVFFVLQFNKPFKSFGTIINNKIQPLSRQAQGKNVKAFVNFETLTGEKVLIKAGLSAVSIRGAEKNLEKEIPHWNFDLIKEEANRKWNKILGKIDIEDKDITKKRIFYTALYHSLLNPNIFADVDGSYRGIDQKIHKYSGFDNYTVFSLWDTFRAAHPLFTIIEQKRTNDFIQTLLARYKEGKILPIWELWGNYTGCMIGYNAVPVIVDAYLKGIRNFDAELAFKAIKHSAVQDHLGLKYYKNTGYIPSDRESESVSKTLEYAYDDWCIARMAGALKKESDYACFIQRAQYYKNLFDQKSGFFRAKRNGNWVSPFDPREVNFNYTEANSWQYSFFVPHDLKTLIKLQGNTTLFEKKLDQLFFQSSETSGRKQADITGLIGQYAHGNEPSHHIAYLYNYIKKPHKAQARVREIMDTMYTDLPDGLCGNEDCGQMSSWYVFSALGFYPVCPGHAYYVIGSPIFSQAAIRLENGKKFIIKTNFVSPENKYIQSSFLNNKIYRKSYLSHTDIMQGGEIVFNMGPKPSPHWGREDSWIPPSKIRDYLITAAPVIFSKNFTFKKQLKISIKCLTDNAAIYYTTDGKNPDKNSLIYKKPFMIFSSTIIKAFALKPGLIKSKIITSKLIKIRSDKTIKLNTRYSNQYTGGGDSALIDTLTGTRDFRTGAWQGYFGVNLDVEIDLFQKRKISKISIRFLQNTRSWIFFPKKVLLYLSKDGKRYIKEKELDIKSAEKDGPPSIREFSFSIPAKPVQYIRLKAINVNRLPPWHVSAGEEAWIFADEIYIK